MGRRRALLGIAGLALALGGATAMAIPWFEKSPEWDWTIRGKDELLGAEVNAEVIRTTTSGVQLARRGERHISIISPPLVGLRGGMPVVEVALSRPADLQATEILKWQGRVILFWQTAADQPFHMEGQALTLAVGEVARVFFTPPIDAASIHRIGVQVPDIGRIAIAYIRMMDSTHSQRALLLARGLGAPEYFDGDSINFHKGPNMLGRGLNYYLIAFCGFGMGITLVSAWVRRGNLPRTGIVAVVLVTWTLGDLLFSVKIGFRAFADTRQLRGLSRDDAIREIYGDATANAAEWLQVIPIGSRVCVLANDGIVVAHRLAYLAAPHVVLVDHPEDADYVAVMGGAEIENEETLVLRGADGRLPIRVVAQWSNGALVERVKN